MPWTVEQQNAADAAITGYIEEYVGKLFEWGSAAQSGNAAQGQAAIEDVLRRWRGYTETLQAQALHSVDESQTMDKLHEVVSSMNDERALLNKLRSEAGTRVEQADSVNPKVTESPYVNILKMQRTFTGATRTGILIASVVIGLIALGALGFLVYRVASTGAIVQMGYQAPPAMTGGGGGGGRR
jgi:hypothetical protein